MSKLSYLAETGITATWLSPIFQSPMVDFGYDISDFKAIHEEYGTMEDFEELIAEANRLGIKIILDFVPNHSSDQCEWFKKSSAREEGYEDFYIWADGKINEDGEMDPPNNWVSTGIYRLQMSSKFLCLFSNLYFMVPLGPGIPKEDNTTTINSLPNSQI